MAGRDEPEAVRGAGRGSYHRVQRFFDLCFDLDVVVAGVRLVELLSARVDRREVVIVGEAVLVIMIAPL